jgi:hypothetical protein
MSHLKQKGEAMGVFGMSANVTMAVGHYPQHSVARCLKLHNAIYNGLSYCAHILLLALPISKQDCASKEHHFSAEAFSLSYMFTISLTIRFDRFFPAAFCHKAGYNQSRYFFTVFAITLILVRALAGRISDIKGRKFVIVRYDNNCLWPHESFHLQVHLWFIAAAFLYGWVLDYSIPR